MSNKMTYQLQANVSKALGHPIRMEIVQNLKGQEESFASLLEVTGCLKSNLSQHLKLLADNGIVKVRRDGQCSYFSLTSPKVASACELLRDIMKENLQQQQEILENN